jgi:hypothetical protein
MAHDHHHERASAYYVEQLFNIALCGALGGIMTVMYFNGMVRFLFGNNEVQHQRVLFGGAGLLAMVLVRAVYVWFSAGGKHSAHHHSHVGCDHGDCRHDHHEGVKAAAPGPAGLPLDPALPATDGPHHHHDHDHGRAPWRFLLLVLPVVLFLLGLPNQGIRGGYDQKLAKDELDQLRDAGGTAKGDGVLEITFKELERTAGNPDARKELTGQTVYVTGQYVGDDPAEFSLVRYKQTCCTADAIQVGIKIVINPQVRQQYQLDPAPYKHHWVRVTGRLFFTYNRGTNEFRPRVLLCPDENTPPSKLVEFIPPDPNPWVR